MFLSVWNSDRHGGGWAEAKLRVRGAELGSAESWALGEAANRHVPTLRTHDANGNRVDQVCAPLLLLIFFL